jgi:hypothetical protein
MHEFANLYSSFPSVRNQLNFQQQIPHLSRAFDRDRIDFLIRQIIITNDNTVIKYFVVLMIIMVYHKVQNINVVTIFLIFD